MKQKTPSLWIFNSYSFPILITCLFFFFLFKHCPAVAPQVFIISIPATFFWEISVRFLSWQCRKFWTRHDHCRRFPKKSEDFRSFPSINARSLPVLFPWKIRDCEEVIVIYSFYTWFSFRTWVWVTYFWKLCQARRQQLTFFNQAWEIGPQAWAGVRSKFSTRRRETHA